MDFGYCKYSQICVFGDTCFYSQSRIWNLAASQHAARAASKGSASLLDLREKNAG